MTAWDGNERRGPEGDRRTPPEREQREGPTDRRRMHTAGIPWSQAKQEGIERVRREAARRRMPVEQPWERDERIRREATAEQAAEIAGQASRTARWLHRHAATDAERTAARKRLMAGNDWTPED